MRWNNKQGGIPPVAMILLLAAAGSTAQEVRVEPRVTARWEYSDNMFLDSGDEPGAEADTGLKEVADSFWTLTPGLSASIHGRYIRLSLRGDAGRTVYDKYPELNGWRHELGAGMAAGIAPDTTLTLRFNTERTDQQPRRLNPDAGLYSTAPDDPGTDDTLDVRERYTINDSAAGLMYRPGENDLLGAGYSYSTRESTPSLDGYARSRGSVEGSRRLVSGWDTRFLTAYSQADFDRGTDVDQWDGTLEIGRPFYGDWKWMARYQHKTVNTKAGEPVESPSSESGYQVLNPEIGLLYRSRHSGSLELSAGVFHRVPDGDGDSTTALSGKFRFNRVFTRGSIFLQARTGHEDRIFSRDRFDSTRYYTTGAGADYALTQALAIGGMVFFRRDEYDVDSGNGSSQEPASVSSADSNGFSLALRYKPQDWFSAQFMFTHSDQYSPTLNDQYAENRVMVLLTFSLPYQTGSVPARRKPLDAPAP